MYLENPPDVPKANPSKTNLNQGRQFGSQLGTSKAAAAAEKSLNNQ